MAVVTPQLAVGHFVDESEPIQKRLSIHININGKQYWCDFNWIILPYNQTIFV